MSLRPRRVLAGLKTCVHGGFNYTELNALGMNAGDMLDFSVSTNPYMPPPGLQKIMASAAVERYPDSQSMELRRKLAEKLHINAENILAGSGTTEFIRLIAMAYFRQGDPILILEPTYGEYEVACRLAGAHPLKHRAAETDGFVPRVEELVDIIREKQPRAVFICNPNNPTGKYLPRRDIENIMKAMKDSLLILDEAYVPFIEKSWDSLGLMARRNTIILRSMTKDYGIPGVRLGYAVACREIIAVLRSVLPPWNVNAVAQQAGISVLENDEYLKDSLRKTQKAGNYLRGELIRLGFEVLPSDTHYFLVKVGSAPDCRRALLAKGIMVRDCSSFGLSQYIRISPRTLPDCQRFMAALNDTLKS